MKKTQFLAASLFYFCGIGLDSCLNGIQVNLLDCITWILIGISCSE